MPRRRGETARVSDKDQRRLLDAALRVNLFVAGAPNARSACACCCVGVSLSKQIKMSDAVFSGEVVSIEPCERATGSFPPSLVASPST